MNRFLEAWLVQSSRCVRWLEDAVLALLLLGMVLLAVGQIVLRNVFSGGVVWGDELLRILLLWLALSGAIVASREDHHISIDFFSRYLPSMWLDRLKFVLHLFTAAVCAVIAWHALAFVRMEAQFGARLLDRFPAWWFQSVLPFGFALISLRYVGHALRRLGLKIGPEIRQ